VSKNTNCLKGLRCSKCKQDDEILVWAEMCVSLTDMGADPYADSTKNLGGVAWNETSTARCPGCGFEGTMRDFVIKKRKK